MIKFPKQLAKNYLIYAGRERKERDSTVIMGWQHASELIEFLDA